MDRREFVKTSGGVLLAGTGCAVAARVLITSTSTRVSADASTTTRRYGMVIDLTRCRPDCSACLEACREENNVAHHGDSRWDVHWIRKARLESKEGGVEDGKQVLLLEDGHCLRDQALEACSLARVREAPDFRATSLETLRQMVAAGIGITLLPALAAEPYGVATPGLTLRRFKEPEPARTIAAAWRPGCAREETISHLCSAIEALMQDVKQL